MDAALVILDGWGLGDHDRRDAVKAADTPTFDALRETGAFGTLTTHGRAVGLPDGQMGNSEVGHLTIGAGRVVHQEYTRIEDAVAAGDLADNDAIDAAFQYADEHDGRVHFMGLVSDGGVHSDMAHVFALIELAADRGVDAVTHAFTDGRDTSPHGGTEYLAALEAVAAEHGTGAVATVTGRYYAMDRDENWKRTKRAYDAIVHRDAEHVATSAVDAVEASYDRGVTDEFVEPTVVRTDAVSKIAESTVVGTDGALHDGDAIVWFNFRADRARQLVRMLGDIDPVWDFDTDPPDTRLVTMTQYDETFDLPVAFPPRHPTDVLGEVVAGAGGTQLRIAESEKYPHVTYFINGGREGAFDGERRRIVPSPDVPTYDLQPEMSAPGVTDAAVELIGAEAPDLLILNYANPDMVGHTGDYEAAIAAVEAIDTELHRLVPFLLDQGATVFVTADHGNADDMGTSDDPHTAHTFNPVPFIALGDDLAIRDDGELADIAPTILDVMGLGKPAAMTGRSMLQ